MTELERQHHYRVSWKKLHPKAPPVVMDYMAGSLKQLLELLDRSENVKPSSTEFLIVHQVDLKTGAVQEVLGHESKTGLTVVDFRPIAGPSQQEAVLTEINRIIEQNRKLPVPSGQKPRIKLKASVVLKQKIGGFFYTAYEATKE
jgi:hypothetical protein